MCEPWLCSAPQIQYLPIVPLEIETHSKPPASMKSGTIEGLRMTQEFKADVAISFGTKVIDSLIRDIVLETIGVYDADSSLHSQ
jgi:hypothetical protein